MVLLVVFDLKDHVQVVLLGPGVDLARVAHDPPPWLFLLGVEGHVVLFWCLIRDSKSVSEGHTHVFGWGGLSGARSGAYGRGMSNLIFFE